VFFNVLFTLRIFAFISRPPFFFLGIIEVTVCESEARIALIRFKDIDPTHL
jgi:hypothetical protein